MAFKDETVEATDAEVFNVRAKNSMYTTKSKKDGEI